MVLTRAGVAQATHTKRERLPQLIGPVLSTLSILHSTQRVGLSLHDVFDCCLDNDDDDDDYDDEVVNQKSPDFKHKKTGEGLWLSSTTPQWVLANLPPANTEEKFERRMASSSPASTSPATLLS
ncbi:hypothetical protein B296_00007500 [Ensete ventricosum]|uniref:Uncharacterized protein n=1 Tax=Ensete ventricosum TaxID=4639 RepID=A0A426ZMN5_ENSVE|nr:hypothetical protein B296_00007500 [Ensete ventricosum]